MAELRHYRYFVEIARRGSFTAASASLHVTQSALSEQILHMERELGCTLFDRGRHGASLTPHGEALIGQAEQLLRMAADIERAARSRRRRVRDTFRLALTMSPLLVWMPDALSELRRRYRDVDIHLEDAFTAEIFLRVGSGKIDLGFVSLRDGTQHDFVASGLAVETLMEDDWVVLVADQHPLARCQSVALADLRDERLVEFPSNFSLRTVVQDVFARAGVSPTTAIETGWVEMAIRFVAAGLGVSVVPRAVTLLDHPGVVVVEIADDHTPGRALTALYRKDNPRVSIITTMLEISRERLATVRAGMERSAE